LSGGIVVSETVQQPERVCVLLPAYNEGPNLRDVVLEALEVVGRAGFECSVLVVDDGSTDDTVEVLSELRHADPRVSTIRLRRNSGKSAALRIGLRHATGDIVALMDADGQDDAASIPTLIGKLRDGFDLVTGRRADRQDRFIKRHTSKLYNRTTAALTGVPGRDFNSGLKVMRKEVADSLDLYGELHRYIPVLAHWSGFRVGEMDVAHRARLHGESKFGGNRFWRGFFDLMTVNFLVRYNARPFHLFGAIGMFITAVGGALLTWMLVLKLTGEGIGDRPAFLVGILFVIVGVQTLSLGLIAELLVHSRHTRLDDVAVDFDPGRSSG
jgi:glycosyltransferase involved in cell wall biosynthesis